MPTEVLEILNAWAEVPPARRCGCGALVPHGTPGEPCDACQAEIMADWMMEQAVREAACWTCDGSGFVRPTGHWADEMMGWQPCPECGDWSHSYD